MQRDTRAVELVAGGQANFQRIKVVGGSTENFDSPVEGFI